MADILVIDDEQVLLRSIERALRREHQVSVAQSGIEGIKLARRIRPDLIILDIIMPGIDGYETCRRLRQDPLLRHTPVLFLSALSKPDARVKGFEMGADDYLVKPFDVRELLWRIKSILRRNQHNPLPPQANVLQHGDILLNCQNFIVETAKGQSTLTPVEFDLFYHFMLNPGQTFSSNRLLQEVWDYPTDTGSPDLVRVHIKNLRQKIEPDPRQPIYLKTIPRHGYMLNNNT